MRGTERPALSGPLGLCDQTHIVTPVTGHPRDMTRKSIPAALAVGALLAPASLADAARPAKGTFENLSRSNGVRLTTTRHNVTAISFFCAKKTRWSLIAYVRVRRDGSFRYRGKLKQYGEEGQFWGKHRGSFSGRFTSRRRVRIRRSVAGVCGTSRVTARRTGP